MIKICSIKNCHTKHYAKGYCEKHYQRFKRNGNALLTKNVYHGKTNNIEHRTWRSIIDRCYNKNNASYNNYGGRGIIVCDRWVNSFETFLKDMGKRPYKKHSIDRINNDKGYSKINCRWATSSQQNRNRRIGKNNSSGTKGVSFNTNSGKWIANITINRNKIYLGSFSNLGDAKNARRNAEQKYFFNNNE